MVDINPSTAELQRIINEELRLSNVFVNRLLEFAKVHGWGDKQTLAQLVVILGRENNRLQDELLKAEYAKAYSPQITIPVLNADNVKPLLEAAYYYGEATGDYAMESIAENENIRQLIDGLNHPMTKGVVMDEAKARELLGDLIQPDNSLFGHCITYNAGDSNALIDDRLTADELEAIAWWMSNKQWQ